jgi:hypothetical protein
LVGLGPGVLLEVFVFVGAPEGEKGQFLALVEQLAHPEVSPETRLDLAMQIRNVLTGNGASFLVGTSPCSEKLLLEDSPPVYA